MVTTNICPQLASTDPSQGLPLFHSQDSPCTNTSTGYLAGPPPPDEDDEDEDEDEDEEEELPLFPPDVDDPEDEEEELLEESREPTVKCTQRNI